MSEKLVLGYWNVKGRAEFIRMLLHYLNLPYSEKVYIHGPPPENDVSSWFNEKFSLGMEIPNLPYLIDGDYKISESLAIARYICNKYSPDLAGRDLYEKGRVDNISYALYDIYSRMIIPFFRPDFVKKMPGHVAAIKRHLKFFARFLKGKQYLVGEQLTWIDFFHYEMLCFIKAYQPGILDEISPVLGEYMMRIEALPRMKEFIDRPERKSMSFMVPRVYYRL